MAKRKRPSPTGKDIKRWAEAIDNKRIVDRSTFDREYNDYFAGYPERFDKENRAKIFKQILLSRPKKVSAKRLYRTVRTPTGRLKKFPITEPKELRGKVKSKIVKVSSAQIKIRGKTIIKYRDSKGRFAKLII